MAQAIRAPRERVRPRAEGQHITRSDLLLHPRHFRGRHHAATIFVIVLVAVVAFRLFPSREVTVLNDGEVLQVSATFDPQAEGLRAASVALSPGDRILFADGGLHSSVSVEKARDVRVEADGRMVQVRTQATTVGGALAAAGIDLRPGDLVYFEGQLTTARGSLHAQAFASTTARSTSAPAAGERAGSPVAIYIQRARPVVVYVDTLRLELSTASSTVEGVLADLGMTVRDGDLVRPGLSAPVGAGSTIRLGKARTITVRIDGKEQSLYTTAGTVSDVLRELGLDPKPEELLDPPREASVLPGMTVTIGLNKEQEEDVETPIAAGIVYETDLTMAAGSYKVIPGVQGARVTRYKVTYKNGAEVSRVAVANLGTTREPVPARHISGPKPASAATRPTLNAPDYTGPYTRTLTVLTTWYNASHGGKSPDDPWYGYTSNGTKLDQGVCAVDPKFIPLGTRMYIPKYGTCVAADVGGGVRGAHVDLGFPESAGNVGWGTQTLEIFILD